MKLSFKRTFMFVLTLLALTFSALGVTPTLAAESKDLPSVENFLNSDGSLKRTSGYTGALDVTGYNVTLDAKRGPLFQPAASISNAWSALGATPLIDGVLDIAISGTGDVYAGGIFTDAGGDANADYIAKWNGTAWSALGTTPLNDSVLAIAISGTGDVYAGGYFTDAGGDANADYMAKWNGTAWSALGTTPLNSYVYAIAISGTGDVYAGGYFINAGGDANADNIAKWNGTAWSALGTTPLNDAVYAIAISGTDVYAGGYFINAGGDANADYIAKWNGTVWSALGTTPLSTPVYAIAFSGTDVYAGGLFLDAGGDANADYIAKWNGTAWSALGTTPLNGFVHTIAISGTGDVYAGGNFINVGGDANADYIAKWNGTAWSALGTTPLNNAVLATAISGTGNVYAGGGFTDAGGDVNADYIAVFGIQPSVVNVTSDTADGTFMIGDTIDAKVKFSEIVNVTGTPQLTFETGATDRTVDYVSGSGTDTLLFNYTVQTGDTSADLNYVATDSLTLNGGTIKAASDSRNADLTLPALNSAEAFAGSNSFVIDGILPLASINTKPSDPSNSASATFTFSATDNLTVAPNFFFWCNLDAGTWEACDSGTKSYSGLAAGSHTFELDAYDEAGNAAIRQSHTWTIVFPAVVSINRAGTSPTALGSVDFTVTFSQPVNGVDKTDFNLTTTGVSGAAVSGVSGSGSVYSVTVNTGSGNGSIRLDLIDNDSIKDVVYNSPLGGTGTGNANFTAGQLYSIIKLVTFADVPSTYWASSFIERLSIFSITGGCQASPLSFCPDATVTRAQMAVFLLKAKHGSSYNPPAVGSSTGFADVAASYWAAPWIKQLAAEGITGGCGNSNYCPDVVITRDQMAVFLLKAKNGSSYNPPAVGSSTGFADVAVSYWAAPWIKQLASDSITSGCGGGNYCPDTAVTRAQMAVFVVKTFNLP